MICHYGTLFSKTRFAGGNLDAGQEAGTDTAKSQPAAYPAMSKFTELKPLGQPFSGQQGRFRDCLQKLA
jgi:hypothetical protein